jgi:hypothetical protein
MDMSKLKDSELSNSHAIIYPVLRYPYSGYVRYRKSMHRKFHVATSGHGISVPSLKSDLVSLERVPMHGVRTLLPYYRDIPCIVILLDYSTRY